MASRTIDDFDSRRKPAQPTKNREIDDDDTLRIVGDEREASDFGLDDDETDPGDRRHDPLRQPK